MTPYELSIKLEYKEQAEIAEFKRDINLAWHTAGFSRVKKLEDLRSINRKIDNAVKNEKEKAMREEPSVQEIARRKGLKIE